MQRDANGRFIKGQSGNPSGRPRRSRALSAMLRTVGNRSDNGKTNKRRLAEKLWAMALDGNLTAARIIYEYCDGKPPQLHELEGTQTVTLNVVHIRDWDDGFDGDSQGVGTVAR